MMAALIVVAILYGLTVLACVRANCCTERAYLLRHGYSSLHDVDNAERVAIWLMRILALFPFAWLWVTSRRVRAAGIAVQGE